MNLVGQQGKENCESLTKSHKFVWDCWM